MISKRFYACAMAACLVPGLTVLAAKPAAAQDSELQTFTPDASDPKIQQYQKARSKRETAGLEAAEDAIFANCPTLGVMLDVKMTAALFKISDEEMRAFETEAEKTVTPIDTLGACQIIYRFIDKSDPNRMMSVEIVPTGERYMPRENVTAPQALKDLCEKSLKASKGGTFVATSTAAGTETIDFERTNASEFSSCLAGVPYDLRTDCTDLKDDRCGNEAFVRKLQDAIRVKFVPPAKPK